jgi:AcrR family transcriptional regulator
MSTEREKEGDEAGTPSRRRMIEMGLVGPADDSDNRSRILSAAGALFGERGYASTSLRAIANAVGMTPPALYWYFPSKQAILHALLHAALFDFLDAVEAEVVGPAPQDKLRQFVRAHVLNTLEQPRILPYEALFGYRQMARFLSDEERAELVAGQRRHLDLLRGTLREGMVCGCFRELDVTATAFAIMSMCDYVNSWWKPDRRIGAEELAAQYEDLAMRMVAPSAP